MTSLGVSPLAWDTHHQSCGVSAYGMSLMMPCCISRIGGEGGGTPGPSGLLHDEAELCCVLWPNAVPYMGSGLFPNRVTNEAICIHEGQEWVLHHRP